MMPVVPCSLVTVLAGVFVRGGHCPGTFRGTWIALTTQGAVATDKRAPWG